MEERKSEWLLGKTDMMIYSLGSRDLFLPIYRHARTYATTTYVLLNLILKRVARRCQYDTAAVDLFGGPDFK